MKLVYTEQELPQRSEAWLEARKSKIGGSEVATILGLNEKNQKAITLWKRRLGKLKPQTSNTAMLRGAELEGDATYEAKLYLNIEKNIKNIQIEPYFAVHPKYDFVAVSFDGVDLDNKFIIEIKCPSHFLGFKNTFEFGIPPYYYPQVQYQLFVANAIWGIDTAYFVSYFPTGCYITDLTAFKSELRTLYVEEIKYDEDYCLAMIKVLTKFYDYVQHEYWDEEEYRALVEEFYATTNN